MITSKYFNFSSHYQSEHLLEQLIAMITYINDILARKYTFCKIFILEKDGNRKRIICPPDLDRKFADH